MAEWDIGFKTTAIIQPDVRNPNDKLVFPVPYFAYPKLVNLGQLNRHQIMSYFNIMAVSGKVKLYIDASEVDLVSRLFWLLAERGKKIFELELQARSKPSWSLVNKGDFTFGGRLDVHPSQVVAFMKLTDVKIVNVYPARMTKDKQPTIGYLATFDGS